MAILEENTPTPEAVQVVNSLLTFIVGTDEIGVEHVRKLLESINGLCGTLVPQQTVNEDWLTYVTGTGGGMGGLKTQVLAEIVQKVLKIDAIRSGLDRVKN